MENRATTDDDRSTDDELISRAAMGDADAAAELEALADTVDAEDDAGTGGPTDGPECGCGRTMRQIGSAGVNALATVNRGDGPLPSWHLRRWGCPGTCGGEAARLRIHVPDPAHRFSRGSCVPRFGDVLAFLKAHAPPGDYTLIQQPDGASLALHVRETEDLPGLERSLRGRFTREHDTLERKKNASGPTFLLTPDW